MINKDLQLKGLMSWLFLMISIVGLYAGFGRRLNLMETNPFLSEFLLVAGLLFSLISFFGLFRIVLGWGNSDIVSINASSFLRKTYLGKNSVWVKPNKASVGEKIIAILNVIFFIAASFIIWSLYLKNG